MNQNFSNGMFPSKRHKRGSVIPPIDLTNNGEDVTVKVNKTLGLTYYFIPNVVSPGFTLALYEKTYLEYNDTIRTVHLSDMIEITKEPVLNEGKYTIEFKFTDKIFSDKIFSDKNPDKVIFTLGYNTVDNKEEAKLITVTR
jgi:hypothetical protein